MIQCARCDNPISTGKFVSMVDEASPLCGFCEADEQIYKTIYPNRALPELGIHLFSR